MKLIDIAKKLNLKNLTPEQITPQQAEVKVAHACDLLSDVLANAPSEGLLVTIQVHLNVIAVCVHAGLRAIIFSSGMVPDQSVLQKAIDEGLILYATLESTFDTVGKLYALGLRGKHV